jgi:hypothetical protein
MQSIQDKLAVASKLALDCHDRVEQGKLTVSGAQAGMIYNHSDGLIDKYIRKHISGECSIKAMLEFDLQAEEKRIDEDIREMTKLLS